jgi:hypothetical protein
VSASAQADTFEPEPTAKEPGFFAQPAGRIVLATLAILAAAGALLGLSCLTGYLKQPPPPQEDIVVAARDLRPYQRLRDSDLAIAPFKQPVAGTAITDTSLLVDRAVVLQSVKKGQPVTAGSVVSFSTSVALTGTVLMSIPVDPSATTMLRPGSSVLIVGVPISKTACGSPVSATVPIVDVTGGQVLIALDPRQALDLVTSVPPTGRVIFLPALDRFP